jgi:hypothetical protein
MGKKPMGRKPRPLPPNIQEFNDICAVIFAQLYVSFPVPADLDPTQIAQILGTTVDQRMLTDRTLNEVFPHALAWLIHQRYVASNGPVPRLRTFLTDKALAAMNVKPPAFGGATVGAQLVRVTKDAASEAAKLKMAELVGTFFGSAAKTWADGR